MSRTIVIAGAGHAAGQAAVSLRQGGFDGRLVMVGEEAYVPYQRPPLSKKFLSGELELTRLYFKPENYYAEHDVELILNTEVTGIDPVAKHVGLNNGETLVYDDLLLTTGSEVRRLDCCGSDLAGIHYIRTIADIEALRPDFTEGARLVIVGAGYIGLEVAAVGAQTGLDVTVLEMADRAMARVVCPEVSEFYTKRHRSEGVDLRFGAGVNEFRGTDKVSTVVCSDGTELEADIVVVGVGIIPCTELAEFAGLDCNNGISVDENCRTSDPNIYAAGDCANQYNGFVGEKIRLESVANALEQAKTAAAAMLGQPLPATAVPWFWSDQYDVKLQIVGLSQGYDEAIVRGDPDSGSFAVFYLREGVLIAVDAINSPREFMIARKLVGHDIRPDTAKLADPGVDFKAYSAELLA